MAAADEEVHSCTEAYTFDLGLGFELGLGFKLGLRVNLGLDTSLYREHAPLLQNQYTKLEVVSFALHHHVFALAIKIKDSRKSNWDILCNDVLEHQENTMILLQ